MYPTTSSAKPRRARSSVRRDAGTSGDSVGGSVKGSYRAPSPRGGQKTPRTVQGVALQHHLAPHGRAYAACQCESTRPIYPRPSALSNADSPRRFLLALVSNENLTRTHAFLQEETSYGRSRQCLHSP